MANQIRGIELRQINPTGKSLLIFRNRVKPPLQKYFASRPAQISSLIRTSRPTQRGVAHVTKRGAGCGGRGGVRRASASWTNDAEAYGQVVSFWRPNAGVKSARRSAGDGVKQAWSPGRARSKP